MRYDREGNNTEHMRQIPQEYRDKKYTDFVGNYATLLNALPDDLKWELVKKYPLTDVVEYMKTTFKVWESLIAKTRKSKTREANLKKLEEIREMINPANPLTPNITNEPGVEQDQTTIMNQTPMSPMWWATEEVETTTAAPWWANIGL